MLDSDLLEIIKLKKFKNVWAMLQYLIDIGCEEEEIMDTIPNFYRELDLFKDVAYARVLGVVKTEDPYSAIDEVEWVMFVGMIDESNYKLRGMFEAYKIGVMEDKVTNDVQRDMEEFCNEKYEFRNLSDKTIDYFRNVAIKHYGYPLI